MRKREDRARSTIYDIAKRAGTSASTVSLVLNGSWQRYRINSDTAARVREAADALGYRTNQRARGLRLSRSSLAGMAIPHYRNRFFAGLAEEFEAQARSRGLCPVVVSTQRDRATERFVIETLLAQQVEMVIVAGVDRPDILNELCALAGIACVNLDLPGSKAPSVVSDNRGGARRLTTILVDEVRARGGDPSQIAFVGGNSGEYATEERLAGFREATAGFALDESRVLRCGYSPATAEALIESWARQGDGFPPGIFVNSITACEGFAAVLRRRLELGQRTSLACFDWDPFAASLPVPIAMMRQDVDRLIGACFELIEREEPCEAAMITVEPTLEIVSAFGTAAG
ncbi:LacI family DNA-binding transcriptional regulator [Aureimonas populi]|uniref:LacI family DNA-binding transcriptional regulator n=1 Tax=Aureimonas populi TaxID=1701758 RepID=A0ABW5CLM3_9HYPH|nr:LacI family DNA-binding transcriptional regulator [Aureimonas populi]